MANHELPKQIPLHPVSAPSGSEAAWTRDQSSLVQQIGERALNVAILYPDVYDMARFQEKRKEFPPFGAMYLASVLRDNGHNVDLMNITGEPEHDARDLTIYDTVGYSISSSVTMGMIEQAHHSSTVRKDAQIIAGGVHANFYPEQVLRDLRAHAVAYGESERIIEQLCCARTDEEYAATPGIVWLNSANEVITNSKSAPLPISDLPLPARDMLPVGDTIMDDRLAKTDLKMAHVMLSRGCPFPCTYCAAGLTRMQYRSGESARAELTHLKDEFGIEGFSIVDDNFVVARQRVMEICESIGDLDLKWSALSRVDTVDKELLEKMRDAGCIEIKFGVESGSEKILKAMRKRINTDTIRNAFELCNEVGINAKAFIIHGYPGENMETTQETIDLLRSLEHIIKRVSLFRFVPLPGTQVYDERDANGNRLIHGTHDEPDWDGDWSKFHLYRNGRHWWGTEEDFATTNASYQMIKQYVESIWGKQE